MSRRVRSLVEDMRAEWRELDRRIEAFDDEFAALAKTDDAARRLASIPGIGVLNATALVGGDRQWRDVCAWTRPRGLARLGAAANNDRRQAAADGDQQTGQQISAQAAGPWCPGGPAFAAGEQDADWAWLPHSCSGRTRTRSSSRWPTSWRGSLGGAAPRWNL